MTVGLATVVSRLCGFGGLFNEVKLKPCTQQEWGARNRGKGKDVREHVPTEYVAIFALLAE
jgi:hypothetical protein